jgi:hypothetical protein
MSSIFQIFPTMQRIFLCTRVTNEHALCVYKNWGFTLDPSPILDPHHVFSSQHWTFLECRKGPLEHMSVQDQGLSF